MQKDKKEFSGQLKGMPAIIVEKMLANQVKQGNLEDITVFEKDITAGQYRLGFSWRESIEGLEFWYKILEEKDLSVFYGYDPNKIIVGDIVQFKSTQLIGIVTEIYDSYLFVNKEIVFAEADLIKLNKEDKLHQVLKLK